MCLRLYRYVWTPPPHTLTQNNVLLNTSTAPRTVSSRSAHHGLSVVWCTTHNMQNIRHTSPTPSVKSTIIHDKTFTDLRTLVRKLFILRQHFSYLLFFHAGQLQGWKRIHSTSKKVNGAEFPPPFPAVAAVPAPSPPRFCVSHLDRQKTCE